jgi:hypothetical protein
MESAGLREMTLRFCSGRRQTRYDRNGVPGQSALVGRSSCRGITGEFAAVRVTGARSSICAAGIAGGGTGSSTVPTSLSALGRGVLNVDRPLRDLEPATVNAYGITACTLPPQIIPQVKTDFFCIQARL